MPKILTEEEIGFTVDYIRSMLLADKAAIGALNDLIYTLREVQKERDELRRIVDNLTMKLGVTEDGYPEDGN